MFEQIITKVEHYDSIVIFGHLNPDGDCYGSQVALRAILKTAYPSKSIFAVGSGLSNFYQLLGKMDEVSDDVIINSLAVVLDSNDLSRVEDKRVKLAKDFVKIDHHIDTHKFVEGPQVVDDKATSTCELIYRLAKENNFEIPKVAAEGIYLGMFTDTARFQYASDYVTMFDVLKNLIQLGVVPTDLSAILNTSYEHSLKVKSFIYRNYKKDPAGILYVIADKTDRAKLNISSQQMVANTSLISHIKKYPVWFVATEMDDGHMQVEMRSNKIDVQKICASFGGGGHLFAAGFSQPMFNKENIDELLNRIRTALKEGN